MREGTSGVGVTVSGGAITIEYTDFGVSQFGGGDFEMTYYLDKENSDKLIAALKKEHRGSVKQMIVSAFGEGFKDSVFREFCKKSGIKYSTSTWSG